MGLIIAFIVFVLIGWFLKSDFSKLGDIVGPVLAAIFFWWVGSCFASFGEVLSFNWSIGTIFAGLCYIIAGSIVYMLACTLFNQKTTQSVTVNFSNVNLENYRDIFFVAKRTSLFYTAFVFFRIIAIIMFLYS